MAGAFFNIYLKAYNKNETLLRLFRKVCYK